MIEQLNNQELDQVNGGHHYGTSVSVYIKNSFNTGGTRVGDISVHADDSMVSISVGSSGGLLIG